MRILTHMRIVIFLSVFFTSLHLCMKKITIKNTFTIAFFILLAQFVSAQNSAILKGRIYDKSTNEPMPFANISVPGTGTGVISNEYGEFVYHIPKNIENEPVLLSFIGYETIVISVDTLKPDFVYMYRMQPKTVEIGEVYIVAEKLIPADRLVRQAIRNISRNYPRESFQLYGYYRDYIRNLNTNDYNNLTEAAVIIEDNGFNTNDYKRTKIKLEQVRYNPLLAADTSLNIGYDGTVKYVPNADISGSNELALLLFHNPIRNHNINSFSFVDVFDNSFLRNHEFHYETISENDSIKIYELSFATDTLWGMVDNTQYLAEGTIHIKADDLAILKFNYIVNCNTPTFTGKLLEVRLEFKDYSDKYYLSYISMDNYFEITFQTFGMYRPKIEHLYQYRELFINKIITEIDQPVSKEEAIEKGKILIANKVPEIPGFWDQYNIIINEKLSEE